MFRLLQLTMLLRYNNCIKIDFTKCLYQSYYCWISATPKRQIYTGNKKKSVPENLILLLCLPTQIKLDTQHCILSHNEYFPKQTQIKKTKQKHELQLARKPLFLGRQLYQLYSLLTQNPSLCASLGKTWLYQPHRATRVVILWNLAASWSQWCCHGHNHSQKHGLCSGVKPASDSGRQRGAVYNLLWSGSGSIISADYFLLLPSSAPHAS